MQAKFCDGRLWHFGRLSYSQSMLPILRILPVGGVLLAITILVLALSPPDGSRREWPANALLARGALLKAGDHPEWRQFLILSAIQRADELSRLRDLPDTPVRDDSAPAAGKPGDARADKAPDNAPAKAADEAGAKVAGLPAGRGSADPDPDDVTGTIADVPAVTMPVEIGETSSTELSVAPRDEKPPVLTTPNRARSRGESLAKPAHRVRRAKATPPARKPHAAARPAVRAKAQTKDKPAATPNFFEALFGGSAARQQTGAQPEASAQR